CSVRVRWPGALGGSALSRARLRPLVSREPAADAGSRRPRFGARVRGEPRPREERRAPGAGPHRRRIMKLLGIETSGRVGSVALSVDGRIEEREIANAREQTERLLAVVDELLAGARLELTDLDGIAFGRGPGSFPGLRVSAAVAQGLAAP